MKKVIIDKLIPKWTKRVIIDETRGRDPLGLSRVAASITDFLLTGIITTTHRARYYSFYCWSLWHIHSEDKPKKYQGFVDGFRRREAFLALSTVNSHMSSPVGVDAATLRLAKGSEEKQISCDFRVLPSNNLGGYGQYYSGSLKNLQLIEMAQDGTDHIANETAEVLTQCFHSSVKTTPYIKKKLFRKTYVPLKDLQKSQHFFTIDALREPFAKRERQELIKLFFGFDRETSGERTILRKHTLSQILHIILEYQKRGIFVNTERKNDSFPAKARDERVDWHIVCLPLYYGILWFPGKKVSKYKHPKTLDVCHSLWMQFCVQQFFTQALEELMHGVLETIGQENGGLELNKLLDRLLNKDFLSALKKITGTMCDKPYKLFSAFGINNTHNEEESLKAQQEFSILHPKSEMQILNIKAKNPETHVAKSLCLLSVLYAKWRGVKHDYGFNHIASRAGTELWIGSTFSYLDNWLDKQISWSEALRALINDLIIKQHDRIMYEKRRLDSCWLERVEGKIVKIKDYEPAWRSSRHDNAISIMCDLGLLKEDLDGNISITADGKKILDKVLM